MMASRKRSLLRFIRPLLRLRSLRDLIRILRAYYQILGKLFG